ncbi:MAG: hypothetical protein KTR14_11265 [Vampirovibrio sp.]|nr:hypothetical protein [Vampirovibrio sp.]
MSNASTLQLYFLNHESASGVENMAADEALLETLREVTETPLLVVRTYQWQTPTWSLGVNQKLKSLGELDIFLMGPTPQIVRRPTGGRAILHDRDISFAFVTNDSTLLSLSLKESYCHFTQFLKEALSVLTPLATDHCTAENTSNSGYTRSNLCFETQTPGDLLDAAGNKICGSAQLRRAGGILQHGAAFLPELPNTVAPVTTFRNALYKAVASHYKVKTLSFIEDSDTLYQRFQTLKAQLLPSYESASRDILSKASITSGSQ